MGLTKTKKESQESTRHHRRIIPNPKLVNFTTTYAIALSSLFKYFSINKGLLGEDEKLVQQSLAILEQQRDEGVD